MRDGSRARYLIALVAIVAVSALTPVGAQDNTECYDCHDDDSMESLYVPPTVFDASVHGFLECIDCHEQLIDAEFEHDVPLAPVDCAMCHDDTAEEVLAGPHGDWLADTDAPADGCIICHGVHDVLPATDPAAPTHAATVDLLCADCHDDVLEVLQGSVHGAATEGGPMRASCVQCHTGHDPSMPVLQCREMSWRRTAPTVTVCTMSSPVWIIGRRRRR